MLSGWPHNGTGLVKPSQLRAAWSSPNGKSLDDSKELAKSKSTPQLPKMTAVATPTSPTPLFRHQTHDSQTMNTIPDPRSPTPSSAISRTPSAGSGHHPDLSDEVATLSTKLINAINLQTNLDDSLQATKHDLEVARERVAQLEAAAKEHEELISQGLLLRKEDVDKRETQMVKDLAEERRQRAEVEKQKKGIETELENLTTALFEEANTMVAAARKEREASDRRNDQLKSQLKDTEMLLTSQQEQLHDLKAVMQEMSPTRDDEARSSTVPSTPATAPPHRLSHVFDDHAPNTPRFEDMPPDQPLRFTHLIHPILRNDIEGYNDFKSLLATSKGTAPSSRTNSGSFGGLNVLGSLGRSKDTSSTSSLPNGSPGLGGSSSSTPNVPGAFGTSSPLSIGSPLPPLKDEKFYKRALAEDIEPTLRLDIAPGLSWMARRSVLSSMASGSLVVEPMPPPPKFYGPVYACALCGENRKNEPYKRHHRFRTSEADDAQRYPLCEYCLGRVRATCDYIGFLRMLRDGHWRAETDEEMKSAWEESVRLRERMFWTRVGGGVVPVILNARDSPSLRNGSSSTIERGSEDSLGVPGGPSLDIPKDGAEDPFKSRPSQEGKRVSIGKTVIDPSDATSSPPAEPELDSEEERKIDEQAAQQLRDNIRDSLALKAPAVDREADSRSSYSQYAEDEDQPLPAAEEAATEDVSPKTVKKDPQERLSLTIPGSFDLETP